MRTFMKMLALMLTTALLVVMYYGIAQSLFLSEAFWLIYVLIVITDLLCIAYLKRTTEQNWESANMHQGKKLIVIDKNKKIKSITSKLNNYPLKNTISSFNPVYKKPLIISLISGIIIGAILAFVK